MPREGYLNYKISERRQQWFDAIAALLDLDPNQHKDQVRIVDFALKYLVYDARKMRGLTEKILNNSAESRAPAADAGGGQQQREKKGE